MKKVIVLLAACLGLNTAINAQEMQKMPAKGNQMGLKKQDLTPEQRASKGATWAEKALGLNADQKSKWQAAALTRIQANGPLRDKLKATTDKTEKQKIRQDIKANLTSFDTTVGGFLTAEQKTKWDEIKKQKREAHKLKMGKEGDAKDAELKDVDQD